MDAHVTQVKNSFGSFGDDASSSGSDDDINAAAEAAAESALAALDLDGDGDGDAGAKAEAEPARDVPVLRPGGSAGIAARPAPAGPPGTWANTSTRAARGASLLLRQLAQTTRALVHVAG